MSSAFESTVQVHVPRRPLSGLVAALWYVPGSESDIGKERVLPTGSADLAIRLDGDAALDGGISGPRSRPVVVQAPSKHDLLGVHFRPGGAFPFLGLSPAETLNRYAGLAEVWGQRCSARLLGALSKAKGVDGKFRTLERWLVSLAQRRFEHHPAVAFALEASMQRPESSVASLVERSGYSQRRFIELFRNEVGMKPKLFCRLRRFRAVVRDVKGQPSTDWADLAVRTGYFDQSHLIRDFREFGGVTPGEYLEQRTIHINHLRYGN